MDGVSFKSTTFMILIALLVWCSSIETCIARRGKHWRQIRYATASLSKKKGSNNGHDHGHGHRNFRNGGLNSKPKPPLQSHEATPSPLPSPKPIEESIPSIPPPHNGYGDEPQSSVFNVLDFGAQGDGETDDTKEYGQRNNLFYVDQFTIAA